MRSVVLTARKKFIYDAVVGKVSLRSMVRGKLKIFTTPQEPEIFLASKVVNPDYSKYHPTHKLSVNSV